MIDFVRDHSSNQPNQKAPQPSEALSKVAYSFHQKGDTYFRSNHFAEAKASYEKSLDAYKKMGDLRGAGLSLTRLGRVSEILGEYAEARKAYKESLEIFQGVSDLQGIARSKAHLGNMGWATGDYQESSNFLQEALSLYRLSEDVPGEAWVHDLMGNLRLAMREDEEAERHYLSAYSLAKEQGESSQVEAWNQYHLGAVALFRGQMDGAKEQFSEALQGFTRLKDDLGQVATLVHLGEIACSQKNLFESEQYLQKAIQLVLPTHCKPLLADALTGVAQLLKAKGDERKAISLLMVALSHPTCRQQTKDRMVALVLNLESSFSRQDVEGGFKWAKDVSIEEMASAWALTALPKAKTKNKKRN